MIGFKKVSSKYHKNIQCAFFIRKMTEFGGYFLMVFPFVTDLDLIVLSGGSL